jgi:hypothetical protein
MGGVETFAPAMIIGGALVDLLVGAMIVVRRTHYMGLWLALAVSFFYVITGTILVPSLWADPLGPMLKIWPIIGFNLALIALASRKPR